MNKLRQREQKKTKYNNYNSNRTKHKGWYKRRNKPTSEITFCFYKDWRRQRKKG